MFEIRRKPNTRYRRIEGEAARKRVMTNKPSNDTPAPSQAGWRLVPIEPTFAMASAGGAAIWGHASTARHEMVGAAYRAMLAAAPLPEPPDTRTEGEAPGGEG